METRALLTIDDGRNVYFYGWNVHLEFCLIMDIDIALVSARYGRSWRSMNKQISFSYYKKKYIR